MIKQDDLRLNGSGYTDYTAYRAIRNVEDARVNSKDNYSEGDIVIVNKIGRVREEILLISLHQDYASGIALKERRPVENAVPVNGRKKMYSDAGRPCYVYYSAIEECVKTVDEDELRKVRNAIASAFGIEQIVRGAAPVVEKVSGPSEHDMLKLLMETVSAIGTEVDEIANTGLATEDRERIIRAEAERDVYKRLYEQERMNQATVA